MKKLIIVGIIYLLPSIILTQNFTIQNNNFEVNSIADITLKGENKAILGYYEEDMPGHFYIPKVYYFKNEVWNKIDTKIQNGNETNFVFATSASMIKFDSTNNIWVSGFELYKYNGEKWETFSIKDDDFEDRKYQQFVIDKFNNLWITTNIYNKETKLGKSELLKLEGDEFTKVLEFPTPFSFVSRGLGTKGISLSTINGKVFVQRSLDSYEQDVLEEKYEDLYTINQDLSYERIRLQTPSKSTTNGDVEWNKNLVHIYPENENKVWFCYDFQGDGWQGDLCCSGLSLLNDEDWILFDEKYDFPKQSEDLYSPFYRILKLKEDGYIVVGKDIILKMDGDFNLKELDWYNLINNSIITISNSDYNTEEVSKKINGLIDKNKKSPKILSLYQENNGDICFHFQFGIIKVNNSKVMSVNDNNTHQSARIFPNPVEAVFNFSNKENFEKYEIFDLLGNKLLEGNIDNNYIDVALLQKGTYIFKVFNSKSFKHFKFVKI